MAQNDQLVYAFSIGTRGELLGWEKLWPRLFVCGFMLEAVFERVHTWDHISSVRVCVGAEFSYITRQQCSAGPRADIVHREYRADIPHVLCMENLEIDDIDLRLKQDPDPHPVFF